MEEETKNRLVKKRLLNEEVYDRIKEMISDHRFNPGTHINVPHKGVKIRELGFKETKDLYEVRESLECRAAGRLPATTCSPTPGSSSHQFSYDRKQIK